MAMVVVVQGRFVLGNLSPTSIQEHYHDHGQVRRFRRPYAFLLLLYSSLFSVRSTSVAKESNDGKVGTREKPHRQRLEWRRLPL
jgi:hypothetical protein